MPIGRTTRRAFIAALGSAAAWPLVAARGQQRQNVPLVGVMSPGFTDPPGLSSFYGALHELGYTEGQNIRLERRYADWKTERFAELAADLVRLKVDLIVVMSTSPARAVQEATNTIPIVVAGMALPAMYAAGEFVEAGGLMSYGANLTDLGRRTSIYVDKILRGAKPGDLPVEQPTKFELLVNLKTAGELNLTIPREFLLLVDEVIE
jgi:ABC-type uncharacterized transport system substrate-binding protein